MSRHLRVPIVCRHCGKRSVLLTRPCTLLERLLRLIFLYPYRCHHCDRRAWRFGRRQRGAPADAAQ